MSENALWTYFWITLCVFLVFTGQRLYQGIDANNKRQYDQNMACISAKGTVVGDQCIHPMLAD